MKQNFGLLTIKGNNIRINKLSIDTSEVIVEGNINSINYNDKEIDRKGESFLGKIFK